ncbi:hypothetical protein [Streptomyces sp. bgisy154]|uniref:hypothetical protein n=1 Tax=Streptomyces sp. bgisy154 TaxID=3413794 RepID=UPI003D74CC91
MTRDHPDRYAEEAAALERLTRRHGGERYRRLNAYGGPYLAAAPLEVVNLIVSALHRGDEEGVTGQDLDDALLLLGRAREELDHHELELVDHARLRYGRTWEQIGRAVGDGDRRTAQTRYSRLRERTPGYAPPATDQEATSA